MPLSGSTQDLVRRSQENFPVASALLPGYARAPILNFYRFAREADNIADSPVLSPEDKLAQLETCRQALLASDATHAPEWMHEHLRDIQAGKVTANPALDLLSAFMQDAVKTRYKNFPELRDYCQRSAASVGRLVLEACGEKTANLNASDSLCSVLQLLNHFQDVQEDYRSLDRVYLPQDWMEKSGVRDQELDGRKTSSSLQHVFNQYIEQCYVLLALADALPATLTQWRTRFEIAFILELAYALTRKLSQGDPLAGKISLPKWRWFLCLLMSPRRLC